MPKLILISKELLYDEEEKGLRGREVAAIQAAASAGHFVVMLSGHAKPRWFEEVENERVVFLECNRTLRRNGVIIDRILAANQGELKHSQVIIVAAKDDDMLPGFNSKTLIVRADWLGNLTGRFATYGCGASSPEELSLIAELLEDNEPWYFEAREEGFEVFSLTNAGTYGENNFETLRLIGELRSCLKAGDRGQIEAFKAHFLSSVYATNSFEEVDLWGFYPGSSSENEEAEVMAEFCRLARTTFKKRSKGPLFLRHQAASKRHEQRGEDRTDPAEQLRTVHLNPDYQGKIRGKVVCVLDDYLTYGCSFGVAEALLKAAGAKKVIGVSLGKFGSQTRRYRIDLGGQDPFSPISPEKVTWDEDFLCGAATRKAQLEFLDKFRKLKGG